MNLEADFSQFPTRNTDSPVDTLIFGLAEILSREPTHLSSSDFWPIETETINLCCFMFVLICYSNNRKLIERFCWFYLRIFGDYFLENKVSKDSVKGFGPRRLCRTMALSRTYASFLMFKYCVTVLIWDLKGLDDQLGKMYILNLRAILVGFL